MTTMRTPVPNTPRRARRRSSWVEQTIIALLLGMILFMFLAFGALAISRIWYAGRIFPGVSVNDIPVGGMSPREAAAVILVRVNYPRSGALQLKDGGKTWQARPAELGLAVEPIASAEDAFAVGRKGLIFTQIREQAQAAINGVQVAPVLVYDQSVAFSFLQGIAREIDTPAVEASLALQGTEVLVTAGQSGRSLDIDRTLNALSAQMLHLQDSSTNVLIEDNQPLILDVSAEADLARTILSAPLVLDLPGEEAGQAGAPWVLEPSQLAAMLTIAKVDTPEGQRYQVSLREDLLRTFLSDIAPRVVRTPENARFIFNDDTRLLEAIAPSARGRSLDIEKTIQTIQEKLRAGDHTTALEMVYEEPAVSDTALGADLGITELLYAETTYFRGSSAERVQNIQAASAQFHGVLVAPGETYSMASGIGDITLDNGYAEALIIVGDQTVKGVGGGVCQVSTAFFRTAFFAGFPIVERHAHAYRVGYYEQTANGWNANLAGLDATVFVPLVDFKFTNDTPYWLLMETYVSGTSLTWKFYSTSDGRSVDWSSTGPRNVVEPPKPVYRENPDLANGQIRQVDWAAQGADVTVTRTVSRSGEVILNDSVITHYQPWQDVYEYGPGTEIPSSD